MSSTIGFATSSDNGATWNTGWSQTYSNATSTGQYEINETFSTPDMGKNNVVFCIYFKGASNNINGWYFDDLEIVSLVATDAKAQSIDMRDIIPAGNNKISFSVQNTGTDAITSFEAKC